MRDYQENELIRAWQTGEIPIYFHDTVVVGSGCAAWNAADTLYDEGIRDVAVVTEGVRMGTSRNTGSDKQTYYKLSLASSQSDSVYEMAETLFGEAAFTVIPLWWRLPSLPAAFLSWYNWGFLSPTMATDSMWGTGRIMIPSRGRRPADR